VAGGAERPPIADTARRDSGEDWWFLTYLGWAHTEAGNVGVGRTITERSLALREKNGNAAHALAHAPFEQGDAAAAGSFLAVWLPTYDGGSFLNGSGVALANSNPCGVVVGTSGECVKTECAKKERKYKSITRKFT
jgi:hypothetical protein